MVLCRSVPVLFFLALSRLSVPCAAETVLLDFHSPNCGPCQQMRPVINRLTAAGHVVQAIDIQREPQIASRFQVDQVPTFVVLVDGRETSRSVGLTSYQQLSSMLSRRRMPPPMRRPPRQTPDTFVTPIAPGSQPTSSANNLATPQSGRIVAIQDPATKAVAVPPRPAATNPFPTVQQGQTRSHAGSPNDRSLIEATVKIAVQDPDGTSAGTGTIVDARSGEALVLTCGHIFRSSAGKGPITVTMFQSGPTGAQVRTTATGRLIDFDLERDLALLSFRTEVAVQAAHIAPAGTPLTSGAAVATVGCNLGANPTVVRSHITTIDRYQGPPNVEVAGAPVEGRSGGGLFDAQGQLIGVCFAADPEANEGLYASLPSIVAKLESLGLSMVYQTPAAVSQVAAVPQQTMEQPRPATNPSFAVRGQEPAPIPPPTDMPFAVASQNSPAPALSGAEQATLEEIQRRSENSEVICIIRPKHPGAKSEVITLSNASPEFVRSLNETAVATGPAPPRR